MVVEIARHRAFRLLSAGTSKQPHSPRTLGVRPVSLREGHPAGEDAALSQGEGSLPKACG